VPSGVLKKLLEFKNGGNRSVFIPNQNDSKFESFNGLLTALDFYAQGQSGLKTPSCVTQIQAVVLGAEAILVFGGWW
jgi:hypothetical protein